MRRAKDMNMTMLGRLGWRVLNDEESLWSRTMESKYGRGREGLNIFMSKIRYSHVWRGLVDSSKILEGFEWRVGNSRSVRFWEDGWLEDKPLVVVATAPIPDDQ